MTEPDILRAHLLKTLDCMSKTARDALDDLNKDADLMREQIESLGKD